MVWHVEHKTAGVLMEGPWTAGRWRWSWSKPRNEALQFDNGQAARWAALVCNKRDAYLVKYEDGEYRTFEQFPVRWSDVFATTSPEVKDFLVAHGAKWGILL